MRFFQGHILPNSIDKRKAHFSNLIASGQTALEEAVVELAAPIMTAEQLPASYDFATKTLGLVPAEFEANLLAPRVEHTEFDTREKFFGRSTFRRAVQRELAR